MTEKQTEKKCRFSLIFSNSETKADIEKIAYIQRKSANELINIVLDEYVKDKGDMIAKYDNLFSEAD